MLVVVFMCKYCGCYIKKHSAGIMWIGTGWQAPGTSSFKCFNTQSRFHHPDLDLYVEDLVELLEEIDYDWTDLDLLISPCPAS